MSTYDWDLPTNERIYLRELARKQADIAALPIMAKRKKQWTDLNDGVPGTRPPFVIETWTFNRDFMPEGVLQCQSKLGRQLEWGFQERLRNHEFINDDKVMPDRYEIGWHCEIDRLGIKIPVESIKDSQGVNTGYHFDHPIKDLARDLDLLQPARCCVDRPRTYAWKAFLEDLFGDLLPVEIRTGSFADNNLTQRVVHLMGMEAFFTAMYDTPDLVHRLMRYLAENSLRVQRWAESEGLLRLNNGNQQTCGTCFNFTTKLPTPGYSGAPARLCDMWGVADSQETVGISAAMFHEFCFPYYRMAVGPLGLLYFGCCEPADPFWDDLSRLPHLKKISISRWANQQFMADALRGTDIVFSRKPDPNLLGVAPKLDEEAWSANIRETLSLTKGVFVELVVRDVYTVHGDLYKPRRAVELAHRELDRAGY